MIYGTNIISTPYGLYSRNSLSQRIVDSASVIIYVIVCLYLPSLYRVKSEFLEKKILQTFCKTLNFFNCGKMVATDLSLYLQREQSFEKIA